MEKKYPSIKLTKEAWGKIFPIVKKWGCNINNYTPSLSDTRIVSNYGNPDEDLLIIGTTVNDFIGGKRYLVQTEDEFLSAVAKLIGKSYSSFSNSKESIKLRNKNKSLKLNFKV